MSLLGMTFIINLVITTLLQNSMAYFWELIHQLQFMRYLVLLGITYPYNMLSFISFLQFASSNMDSFTEYVPGVIEYIVDEEALTDDVYMLPSTFIEEGIEKPFVFLEFWLPCLMMVILTVFVIIPFSIFK